MPTKMAEQVRSVRDRIPGERKHVTILFADVKGSTELADAGDIEDAYTALEQAVRTMSEAVYAHEGVVSKVMGDGVMAIFGAPLAFEDHAARACQAALEMREALRHAYPDMGIRIGLNSGEVVVLSVGDDLHMEYDAIGPTVHLAARMEQTATPGSIRMTKDTYRLTEAAVDVTPLEPVLAKGFSEPIEAYLLKAFRMKGQRIDAALQRGLTPLCGRSDEMAVLRHGAEIAAKGRGQVIALVGGPGVGKTRLAHEAIKVSEHLGFNVWRVAATPESINRPYHTLRTFLTEVLEVSSDCEAQDLRKAIDQLVGGASAEFEKYYAPLISLLGTDPNDDEWTALEPALKRSRIIQAVPVFLAAIAGTCPALILMEDLQWLDGESQAVLDGIFSIVATNPIFLILTFRPEYADPWGHRSHYKRLHINNLEPEPAKQMLDHLLGSDPALNEVKERLIERTSGTPLFLEESVRTLADEHKLTGRPGDYKPVGEITDIALPISVQAIIAARVDRLTESEKQVLQSAATIGQLFPLSLLESVSGHDTELFGQALGHLQELELLREVRQFPSRELAFSQHLAREVTYNAMIKARRIDLHCRIFKTLAEMSEHAPSAPLDQLAYHAFRGEMWPQATEYHFKAGKDALSHWANREAIANFTAALEALEASVEEGSSSSPEADNLKADLILHLAQSQYSLGNFEQAEAQIADNRRLIDDLPDRRLAAQSLFWHAHILTRLGQYEAGRSAVQSATEEALAAKDLATAGKAQGALTLIGHMSGESIEGLNAYRRSVELLESAGDNYWLGMTLFYAGMIQVTLGKFHDAMDLAKRCQVLGPELRNDRLVTYGLFLEGWCHIAKGDIDPAIEACEAGVAAAPDPTSRAYSDAFLGYALMEKGQLDDALEKLLSAADKFKAFKFRPFEIWFSALAGEAARRASRFDQSQSLLKAAIGSARDSSYPWGEAWALRSLGQVEAGREDFGEALKLLRRAVMKFDGIGAEIEATKTQDELTSVELKSNKPLRKASH